MFSHPILGAPSVYLCCMCFYCIWMHSALYRLAASPPAPCRKLCKRVVLISSCCKAKWGNCCQIYRMTPTKQNVAPSAYLWWSLWYGAGKGKLMYLYLCSFKGLDHGFTFETLHKRMQRDKWQSSSLCLCLSAEIMGFKQIRLWDRMGDCTGMSGKRGV